MKYSIKNYPALYPIWIECRICICILFISIILICMSRCTGKRNGSYPFSHLDTVQTKPVEKKENKPEEKKGDGTSFSSFDNIK
jgi:hypothetical protein